MEKTADRSATELPRNICRVTTPTDGKSSTRYAATWIPDAPPPGVEPGTLELTALCSASELQGNRKKLHEVSYSSFLSQVRRRISLMLYFDCIEAFSAA